MKRSKHLEPLSHDHFEGLLVARRIHAGLERGADPAVVSAYVVHFHDHHLARHFEQEEELLLPLLSGPDAAPLGERMVREHRRLHALVTDLRETGTPLAPLLETFAGALRDHIRFEERDLFPHLEAQAAEADLARVSARLNEAHAEADLDWGPRFWE